MKRNHEYYIGRTACEAIKKVDKSEKKPRPWGDRLTYTGGSDERHLTKVVHLLLTANI